jgi:imidazoleglycerol phosphate dehydratase HisB
MDDCLSQVAIDFGGRSWLVWDAEFKREKLEMFLQKCSSISLNLYRFFKNESKY